MSECRSIAIILVAIVVIFETTHSNVILLDIDIDVKATWLDDWIVIFSHPHKKLLLKYHSKSVHVEQVTITKAYRTCLNKFPFSRPFAKDF